jgi:glycosyltransferase involved in cell wall biosynthesis
VTETNHRLIVVLGMHRSGTSAITRALKVLGIDLGDRLLSAADGDNDKGYWEDIDFNTLNIEMLHALDKDWYHTSPIDQIDLEILNKRGYFLKAGKLLNEKLKDKQLFGLKDPRMAKLLPFWKDVFAKCDINVNYVLAIRHPLSVVKSLEKRGWESRERSYLLWLNHVIASLSLTDSNARVLVDYDHLMRDSANELARMAQSLTLSIDKKELAYYQSEFLDPGLQHSEYQPKDSSLDPCCPALAAEIYLKLQDVISETGCADDKAFQHQVTQWTDEYNRLRPILAHIDHAVVQSMQAEHQQTQKESENLDLRKNNVELDGLATLLRGEKNESETARAKLKESLLERGEQITESRRQLIEYDGLVHKLNRDITGLNEDVTNRDDQIAESRRELIEYNGLAQKLNGDVAELNEIVRDRDTKIEADRLELINYDGLAQKLNADVAELNEIVTDRDTKIEADRLELINYDGLAQKLNGDVAELNKIVTDRDTKIEADRLELINYDGLAQKLNGDVAELNEIVIDRETEIEEHLRALVALKDTITEQESQLEANLRQLVENDGTFETLNRNISALTEEIGISHQHANTQVEILNHREHEATDLREALIKLETLCEHRLREIETLTIHLSETHASTSWRITSPIRLVKNTCTSLYSNMFRTSKKNNGFNADWYLEQNPDVKISGHDPLAHYLQYGEAEGRAPRPASFFSRNRNRLQILTSLTSEVIKETGGIYPALKKAGGIIQREGWVGFRRRILHSYNVRFNKPAIEQDYINWIDQYDTLTADSRSYLAEKCKNFSHQPLISIVMPVYNANSIWLAEAIESVCNQIYQNWELCIADDASTDKSIRPLLERYAAQDPRIKLVFREQNGHISATSNSALEIVEGEWIALLDHDDLLSEHALFWIADCIDKNKSVQMIYSDEDKIDEGSVRSSPYFKCDWNIDLFYSQNMFSHLGAYRTNLVNSVGGFRLGIEGSQDYDLALRCIEKIDQDDIKHIPRVLYHWRIHAESTASSSDAKPYAMIAGERALNEHFERSGIHATAELLGHGYRTRYALPSELPLVSLIIPTRDNLFLLKQCIKSILEKTNYPNYEILIVDNGSVEPDAVKYLKKIQKNPLIRVIHDDRPFNYSALNNQAVAQAKGEIVGLLNNDIEVISKDWLDEMVSLALQENAGAIGARLLYPNDTVQHAGIILGFGKERVAGHAHIKFSKSDFGYFGRATLMQSFSAVTAACLVIRKDIYDEVEGLNENELGVGFNDVDFCLRVRAAGYKNVWTPYAELYHHESASRGHEDDAEKRDRFEKEVEYMQACWGDVLLSDPAYSPNLTLDYGDFTYAWPPRLEQLA